MNLYALTNLKLIDNNSIYDTNIIIKDNKIEDITTSNWCKNQIDLQGQYVSHGLVDLQLNGCGGVLFNTEPCLETLEIMHSANLKSACTNFMPTFITDDFTRIEKAINACADYFDKYPNSNSILGLHLEGPFLDLNKKGIHPHKYILKAIPSQIDYICAHNHVIKKITLAPEAVSLDMVKKLVSSGILVALGHTNCTFETALKYFNVGARFTTHLFNAMSALTSREPGLVGATLYNKVYAGIIADGYHVDYANISLASQLLDERLILVSDATSAAASNIDKFEFVGTQIFVKDKKCVDENNTLAGSALTLDKAVQNVYNFANIDVIKAVKMASIYSLKALGQNHKISKGMIANLAVFDAKLNFSLCISNGRLHNLN